MDACIVCLAELPTGWPPTPARPCKPALLELFAWTGLRYVKALTSSEQACLWNAGVRFSMRYDLPGATMELLNSTVVIQNSVFSHLTWHGQAVLVLSGSDVTLFNTTFSFNNNSGGALWLAEAAIVRSWLASSLA